MEIFFQELSRFAIWVAIALWTIAIARRWFGRESRGFRAAALAFYFVHALGSFGTFYEWSIDIALADTAEKMEAVTGWKSDFGLWVNFVFMAFLAADLRWNFRGVTDGVIIFMVVNGAIVFATGPVRWFGIAAMVVLAVVGWRAKFGRRGKS